MSSREQRQQSGLQHSKQCCLSLSPCSMGQTSNRSNNSRLGIHGALWAINRSGIVLSTICNLMARNIPHSTVTMKPGDQPWFNGECKRVCQEQQQAYLKMRCQPGEPVKQDYLHAKRQKQQVIDRAKRSHSRRIRPAVLPHPVGNSGGQLNNSLEEDAPQISPSSLMEAPSISVQKIRPK